MQKYSGVRFRQNEWFAGPTLRRGLQRDITCPAADPTPHADVDFCCNRPNLADLESPLFSL